jgi:hypothetical protein
MKNTHKLILGVIITIFISIVLLRGSMVVNSINGGKKLYEVKVNSYNTYESYLTNEFTKDKETGCITFKDEIGIKRIVCNNYTITEF